MGGLIQTKGTQRLARHFNSRFDLANATPSARNVVASVSGANITLRAAFASSDNLLTISDNFIAQNAVAASWPTDMNDFLYPSATLLTLSTVTNSSTLTFTLPSGFSALPNPNTGCAIVNGAAVCGVGKTNPIPKDTTIASTPTVSGTTLTVQLSGPVTVPQGAPISFARGKHERLVRRWRWYLQFDLESENHETIKRAISAALEDPDYDEIVFHTVEGVQQVIVTPHAKLDNNNNNLTESMSMNILLITQATTSPDKLDPQ
jgi:hypothetical protein